MIGDEERISQGKITSKQKGLKWSKNPPDSKVYMPVKRDDSHMAKDETGFLNLAQAEPTHAYDVGGQWKLLYKKPGGDNIDEHDKPKGPGMKPRKKSKSPTPPPSTKVKKVKARSPKPPPKLSALPKPTIPLPDPPMNIFVRCRNGTLFTLDDVKPEDTIEDIQLRIEKDQDNPRKNQRLRFHSRSLSDPDKTLKECNIKDRSTLDLDPMQIVVREHNNKKHILDVSPIDTINDVKKKVFDMTGISEKNQRFKLNEQLLEKDSKTLKDYGINHEDILDLQPMEISVKTSDGRTTKLVVTPEGTIDDVKKQVKEKLDIPFIDQRPTFKGKALSDKSNMNDNNIKHGDTIILEPMEINVKTSDGRTTKLVVNPEDTIDDVKKEVKEKLEIPFVDQRPSFKGESLSDKSTINDNNIKHGDTIILEPMEINVKSSDGRTTKLLVSPEETIDDIKEKVKKKLSIPVKDQRPAFKGNPLSDKSTLCNNNIKHGDIIDLEPMTVNVNAPDGRTTKLLVSPEDTIDDIKEKVKKNLSIPVEDQRPVFKGNPLSDKGTLCNNNIEHGDTIDLQQMEIYIIDLDGKERTYIVDSSCTIESIKDRVDGDTKVPKAQQRLIFEGNLLDKDNSTLKDIGIEHKDTLRLEPFKINVLMPDGDTITLHVDSEITTDDVKNMIEKREKILPEDQILNFNDTKLNDKTKLKDNGVRHDDTIDLTLHPPTSKPKIKLITPKKTPKKSSYLPADWKKKQDQYGSVTVTTFKVRYDVEPEESIIDGVVSKVTTKFKVEKPVLNSEKNR